MENKIIIHQDRAIIEVRGLDRKKFLQGLITNDIEKASASNLIYSVMLSPQGRFLYDFFIFEIGESLILDCFKLRRDEILQKLNFYKLRSKVEIVRNDELLAAQVLEENTFPNSFLDLRSKSLGYRVYLKNDDLEGCAWTPQQVRGDNREVRSPICHPTPPICHPAPPICHPAPPICHPALVAGSMKSNSESQYNGSLNRLTESEYNFLRISHKIPESELDLTYDKSFILEFGFDNLNAIDYQKGCYVGQELTARTHYRGEIRKKLLHITIDNLQKIAKGQEISCEGKSVGIVLSSVFYNNKLHALALIKLENPAESTAENIVAEIKNLELEQNKITVIS